MIGCGAALCLRPGGPLPTVVGGRPELAPRVVCGQPPETVPQRLGSLYTLCAHAHRLAARLALLAAQGTPVGPSAGERQALRLGSARDQLLRMAVDWPRLMPIAGTGDRAADAAPEVALWLRSCPLWRPDLRAAEQVAGLAEWLQHKLLGCPTEHWLRVWAEAGADEVGRWCRQAPGPVAALLAGHGIAAPSLVTSTRPLQLLRDPQRSLPPLARAMSQPGFVQAPCWDGQAAETGPWTRHHDPAPQPARNAWSRLCSRLADLLRLAAPGGEQWLAAGALPLGPGQAIAWVEMSRGLLLHTVQLESTPAGPRVADYRVLAPTDWNFHPHGPLARALADVRGADEARCLAVAFDPCVAFVVEPQGECARA